MLAMSDGKVTHSQMPFQARWIAALTSLPAVPVRILDGVYWSVPEYPGALAAKVDSVAAEVMGDEMRRRWLHFAPRYLGARPQLIRYAE